jgi:hypothetical protein
MLITKMRVENLKKKYKIYFCKVSYFEISICMQDM